jgi:hypothetical protein
VMPPANRIKQHPLAQNPALAATQTPRRTSVSLQRSIMQRALKAETQHPKVIAEYIHSCHDNLGLAAKSK